MPFLLVLRKAKTDSIAEIKRLYRDKTRVDDTTYGIVYQLTRLICKQELTNFSEPLYNKYSIHLKQKGSEM